MNKKPSVQKAILRNLSKEKLVSIEKIKEDIDNIDNFDVKNESIDRSIRNLLDGGFIESFCSENKKYLRLTKTGKQKLNNIYLENEYSLVSNKWDGYWRIILLDLPEERKNERDALRYLLKKAGFVCIKNSAWISMYPFEHLFTNIKKDLKLTKEMMIIVTDKIDEDTENELFNCFNLNKTNL